MERAYHERCRTAGEYRLYTGFDHVEVDVDDDACHEMCPTAGEYRLYTGFDQSRMMLMMFWSHPYQRQTGRALRQKNGGGRLVPEAGNDLHQGHYSVKQYIIKNWAGTPSKERRLQKSARSGERSAPGALFS